MPSLRYYFTLALSLLAISLTSAQVPDPGIAAQAPVPGAGHQYIGFGAETVNPADGSLTFDLPFSPPTGRQLSFPFGIRYSPAEQFSLNTQVSSSLSWSPIQGPPFQINGWAYLLPTYTFQTFNLSSTPDPNHFGSFLYCDASRNYVFRGFDSTQRSMGIGNVWPDPSNTSTINCGTGSMSASRHGWNFSTPSFTPSANQPPINVTDPSGTVYAFPQGPGVASSIGSILVFGLFAQTITDRNGNQISFTGNQSNGSPPSSGGYKDTLGRTVVSWSGLGTAAGDQLTISGLSSNIVVHWTTKSVTFPENGHDVQHNVVPCTLTPNSSGPDTIQVVSEIDLPTTTTAQRYIFSYDSVHGRIAKITFPSGGYVRYVWGLNTASAATTQTWTANGQGPFSCYMVHDTPAITDRYVSYDGSTEVLHQHFAYSTTWNTSTPYTWDAKTTTLTATDLLTNQTTTTVYTYAPWYSPDDGGNDFTPLASPIPIEKSISYQDGAGHVLKTVNKTWLNSFALLGDQIILDNGQGSAKQYCYSPFPSEQQTDVYEYGFQSEGAKPADPSCYLPQVGTLNNAAIGPLRRHTATAYHNFVGASPSTWILNQPDSVTVYDGSGSQVKQTTFAYAETVTPSGVSTGYVNPSGLRGNISTVTRWLSSGGSPVTSYTYYDTGQVASIKDACGNATCSDMTGTNHTTMYSYSDSWSGGSCSLPSCQTFAYLTQITHPNTGVAHTETFTWGYNDGLIRSRKDVENNLTSSYAYSDPLLRLTQVMNPDNGQTTISYNDALSAPTITTSNQINSSQTVSTVNKMDGLGHTVQTQLLDPTPAGQGTVYTDTTYDGFGRVWKRSNPYRLGTDATGSPGTTTFAYDAIGRKITETAPDNSVINTSYCGPSTLVKDATNRWRRSRTDGLGFLVEVDEPNSNSATVNVCPGTGEPIWVTSYGNDILGNLTSVVQNGSHNRSFSYDSLSRLFTSTNPEVGTITYTYDANSNVSTKRDARNITTTYGYDVLNREKSTTYSNGDPTVTINYDESNCLGFSPCQNVGHETSMTDAAGSEIWAYQINTSGDSSRRSVHINQRTTLGQTKTSTYYLDLASNVTQMVYPSGRVVNYSYDNANRPSRASDAVNGLTYATGFQTAPLNTACVATAVCYTPQGTPYALSVGQSSTFTGLNITESFNSRLQPNQIKASSTGGNALDITYSYADPVSGGNAGHVFSIANNLDSARSQSFVYDQLNRITSAHASTYAASPTKCWGETYSLDAWANLNSITPDPAFNGCSQEAGFSQTANTSNRLSGFQYDASGNTTNDGVFGYQWNAESQLKWLYNVTYTYDGNGRRVSKTGGIEPKLYWYGSGGEILTETNPSALEIVDYVYFGGKRVAQLANDFNLNGGFESGLTNWSASGSGTATAITNAANAHSGSSYVDIVVPPGGAATKLSTSVPISAQQGETIIATAWVYREVGGQQYSRLWMFVNGTNGSVGGHAADNTTMNTWIQQTVSVAVPSNIVGPYTVTLYAEVDSTSSTQSTSARFDDVTLNGNTLLFAEDSLGSTRIVTDTSGVVCYDADFYPYGGERPYSNTCTTHYKFEGKERDAETGNDYFGARHYTNRFGRWLSSDWSAVPVAVPYANLTNPQTLNLYAMVADDPESFADLDGHSDDDWADHVLNFFVSAGATWLSDNAFGALRPKPDNVEGSLGQMVGDMSAQYSGVSEAQAGVTGRTDALVLAATGQEEVAPEAAAVSQVMILHGAATAAIATANLAKDAQQTASTGPKAKDAPGVTAGGQATDKHGNKLGPSSETQVNQVDHATVKSAKDAARAEGKRAPVKHASPKKGGPHFHPTNKEGEKIPCSTHHNCPR